MNVEYKNLEKEIPIPTNSVYEHAKKILIDVGYNSKKVNKMDLCDLITIITKLYLNKKGL